MATQAMIGGGPARVGRSSAPGERGRLSEADAQELQRLVAQDPEGARRFMAERGYSEAEANGYMNAARGENERGREGAAADARADEENDLGWEIEHVFQSGGIVSDAGKALGDALGGGGEAGPDYMSKEWLDRLRALEAMDPNAEQATYDPYARAAQESSIHGLQEVARGGGWTPTDRNAFAQMQAQEAGQAAAQRNALMQAYSARGLGGGTAELAGVMSADQAGANRVAAQGASMQQAAQQRALQAMEASGNLAQGMGSAQSQINQFNSQSGARRRAEGRDYLAGATGQYNAGADRSERARNAQLGLYGDLIKGGVDVISSFDDDED